MARSDHGQQRKEWDLYFRIWTLETTQGGYRHPQQPCTSKPPGLGSRIFRFTLVYALYADTSSLVLSSDGSHSRRNKQVCVQPTASRQGLGFRVHGGTTQSASNPQRQDAKRDDLFNVFAQRSSLVFSINLLSAVPKPPQMNGIGHLKTPLVICVSDRQNQNNSDQITFSSILPTMFAGRFRRFEPMALRRRVKSTSL